jgi:hypothetical protein
MAKQLSECCDGFQCKAKVLVEEEVYFHGVFRVGQVLGEGERILEGLRQAAKAAGWHFDGSQWFCPLCTRLRIMRGWKRPEETVASALDV